MIKYPGMHIIKTFFTLLLLSSLLCADLIYTNWQQNSTLQPERVDTELNIILQAKLKPRYFYNSWSYIFDPKSSVTIHSVLVDSQEIKYTFNNNALLIPLQNITNGQTTSIIIKYSENSQENNPYFFQQQVSIPNFAQGARAIVNVKLQPGYVICQKGSVFTQDNNNNYSWKGIVPEDGIDGLFQYTKDHAVWKFKRTFVLSSAGESPDTTLILPAYFNTGDLQINKLEYFCEPEEFKRDNSKKETTFYLVSPNSKVIIEAEIENKPNKYNIQANSKHTTLSDNDKATMTELALQIVSKNPGKPGYVSLAEWVNKYITYDYGYTGREMSLLEIISSRKGVCEHYADLYVALCRAVSIPAVKITGYAYTADNTGSPNGWGPHAWTLVYVNNKWTPIDPTWGLTQGRMPVSHIGLYFTDDNSYSYHLKNTGSKIFVDDKEIEIKEK